ncbi:MAG: galactose mutarotase [Spirochaetes bacterium]|nr:galactose mutarotase [Spirochaetota bacterium]
MKLTRTTFGKTSHGQDVELFSLQSVNGLGAEIISYGAALKSFRMPDRTGKVQEITLGFDTLTEYEANRRFFGATIGRVANRIAGGRFFLYGKEYRLAVNNGPNHLHGGLNGFDRVVWKGETFLQSDRASVVFTYTSPDGEEGYPGELNVVVTYTLSDEGELSITYEAETNEPTPVNLTNHTFWNLGGVTSTIESLELELRCPFYLPVDDTLIPTGEIRSVKDTPMDFLTPKRIGRDIDQVKPNGYDHCFVIEGGKEPLRTAAILRDPESGRTMEVLTDLPGIQFYSGNMIKEIRGAGGVWFKRRSALCLETELFPDSVHRPHFPSTILHPGTVFRTLTIHRFRVE